MNTQKGFTLIELIMVIVILGILAATAIPRFVDLTSEASQAAAEGIAGSLAAATAINYAGCSAGSTCTTVSTGTDCDSLTGLLQGSSGLGAFTITGTVPSCTVTHTDGGSATFTALTSS